MAGPSHREIQTRRRKPAIRRYAEARLSSAPGRTADGRSGQFAGRLRPFPRAALQPVAGPVVLDKYIEQQGNTMRLDEIQPNAAEQRVKRLKASAKAAKDRAKQLKAQADASAERLDMQKSRQKLAQVQRSAVTSTIKPYH